MSLIACSCVLPALCLDSWWSVQSAWTCALPIRCKCLTSLQLRAMTQQPAFEPP